MPQMCIRDRAYTGPLFMEYHDNQPFSDNMLRPCPLLDNDGKLAEMVHRCGAHSTDVESPEDVDVLLSLIHIWIVD